MPNNSQYLQRNNFLYFSWEKLTSNWGKKIANFWKGEPPNIGCIQAFEKLNNWAVKKYNSLECYSHQLHKPWTVVLL